MRKPQAFPPPYPMNYKTTLFLLALLLILGGFFYFIHDKQPPTPNTGQTKASALLPELKAESISKITLLRGQGDEVIERDDKTWRQTAPVRFPLEKWAGNDLAQAIAGLDYSEKITPGVNGAPTATGFGFEPSKATLRFTVMLDDKPAAHTLELGRMTTGSRAYVRLDDSPVVYVVSDRLHQMVLDKSIDDWRRKTLIVPSVGELSTLTLAHGDTRIEAVKRNGNWIFTGQNTGRVSQPALEQLAQQLSTLYIRKFAPTLDDDLTIYGLDDPRLTLSFHRNAVFSATPETPPPGTWDLRVGGPVDLKGETYFATWNHTPADQTPATASQGPVVAFELAKTDIERLEKSVDDLRDPRLLLAQVAEVRQIAVRHTPPADAATDANTVTDFTLEHSAQGWAFGDPKPGFDLDSTLASALLRSLVEARATGYDASPSLPQQEPSVTLTVSSIGRDEPEVLRIIATADNETDGPLLVYRNDETVGYKVPREQLAAALAPVATLRQRVVVDLPAGDIASLVIHQPDGTTLAFTQKPVVASTDEPPADAASPQSVRDTWTLAGAETFEADALTTLLARLSPLHAARWLPEAPPSPPGDGAMRLEITRRGGTKLTLRFDANAMVATLTTDAGQGPVFEPTPELAQALSAEFRDRTMLNVPLDRMAQVTIQQGEVVTVIVRDAAGRYGVEGRDDLIQAAAGGLFDALAGLRAARWINPAGVKYDAQHPARTLTIKLDDDSTRVLRILGEAQHDRKETLSQLDGAPLLAALEDQTAGRLLADMFAPPVETVAPNAPPDFDAVAPFK